MLHGPTTTSRRSSEPVEDRPGCRARPRTQHVGRARRTAAARTSSARGETSGTEPLDPLVANGIDAVACSGSSDREAALMAIRRRRRATATATCPATAAAIAPVPCTRRTRPPRAAGRRRRSASSGRGWTSTMIPSAPAAAAASDSAGTRLAAARGVARIDDHRQMRELLEDGDRHEVKREAIGGLERADPALAQDHVSVALVEHVLGGHQQLLERARQPALEQRRPARPADLGEQRVVLHVARADLEHVGDLEHRLQVAGVHQLGDDRQAGLAPWPRPAAAGPPGRGPGRRTGTCVACRRRRAASSPRRRDGMRGLEQLLA